MPEPVNQAQEAFNTLSALGGGIKGGSSAGKVRDLLMRSGQRLNRFANRETAEHLATHSASNPWYVCFAVSLSWGHLAKLDVRFTTVGDRLFDRNGTMLTLGTRSLLIWSGGPEPIERSLIGAHMLFSRLTLPAKLPLTLGQLSMAQERWFANILRPDRPSYIGSWNSSAMFMSPVCEPGVGGGPPQSITGAAPRWSDFRWFERAISGGRAL